MCHLTSQFFGTMPVGTGRMVDGVTDGGVGTDDFADEVLSDDDAVDFDPHSAWGGDDEVTAALPSPDSTSTRGGDATAAMPVDTGQVIGGVSDGGFGIDDFADEVLSDDGVDFGPNSAWDGGDEVTAALPSSATVTRKRKGRGKHNNVARDERKRQRRAALLLATEGDTTTGT